MPPSSPSRGNGADGTTQRPLSLLLALMAQKIVLPLVFIAALWILYFAPETVASIAPPLWPRWLSFGGNERLVNVLPPQPNTMFDAWQLGQINARLLLKEQALLADAASSTAEHGHRDDIAASIQALLSEAAVIVGRDAPLTSSELHGIATMLKELEGGQTLSQRVRGFLSFVNVMWFVSICGVGITTLPILIGLGRVLGGPLSRIIGTLYADVVVPVFVMLIPLYEYIAFVGCYLAVVSGVRSHLAGEHDTGIYVALSGLVLSIVAAAYSVMRHFVYRLQRGARPRWGQSEALTALQESENARLYAELRAQLGPSCETHLLNLYVMCIFTPVTALLQSHLLGFIAVVSLYSLLGFSVVSRGLCFVIGFDSPSSLERTLTSSTALVSGFFALRISSAYGARGALATFLSPFTTGVMAFGVSVMLLAALIQSSKFYRANDYGHRQRVALAYYIATIFFRECVWSHRNVQFWHYVSCSICA
eukprot:Opistho-2@7713